jgi:hypothetical protein
VLAGGQREPDQRPVQVVRRADVHDVHLVRRDQFLGGVEGPLGAEPRGRRLRALAVDAETPTTRAPARRAASAWTAPIMPVPAIAMRSGCMPCPSLDPRERLRP